MSSPSHEQLLGYVLGALEPFEHEQLERELANDPELARQAEVLNARLQPLASCRATEPPPPGLAARTCSHVFQRTSPVTPARQGLAGAMNADYGGETSRWSLADMVVAAGIFLAAGMLFFPAIANSRYQAQMAQCQNNLRLVGEAYARGQIQHPNIDYHNLASLDNEWAASGYQAMLLKDQGLLERDNLMLCPSSPESEKRNTYRIPAMARLNSASMKELEAIYREAAGSLAFSLGYLPGAKAESEPNSEYLAIVSDAPSGVMPQMLSSHHDGRGQNVLFASGRTDYICGCGDQQCGDSLFWNRNLKIEAGVDRSDIVLARGGTPSLSTTRLLQLIPNN